MKKPAQIFLIIIILLVSGIIIFYISLDIDDIKNCEKNSDCQTYQVTQKEKYVCAEQGLESSFKNNLLFLKLSKETSRDNCICMASRCEFEE